MSAYSVYTAMAKIKTPLLMVTSIKSDLLISFYSYIITHSGRIVKLRICPFYGGVYRAAVSPAEEHTYRKVNEHRKPHMGRKWPLLLW